MVLRDLTGQKFNRLTVIERAPNGAWHRTRWLCICDCGNRTTVAGAHLKNNHTTSCGCHIRARRRTMNLSHGRSYTTEYHSWAGAKSRCTNPKNPNYPRYGGRGIAMCDAWLNSFETFFADMGKQPPGTSLDRIDNGGPYSKANCRWANPFEQAGNKRNNRLVTMNGRTQHVQQWARELGIDRVRIKNRLKAGWPDHLALTTPKWQKGMPKRPF